ncbi:MAG: ribonuclease Z [Flavobacteriaceae bacterium]|jgi:hypothetical protein|nr:ribonuclease Z [Flavobacteriaceae bacterium]
MKVIVNGRTTELIDTQGDFQLFFEEVSNQYDSFLNQNLILDITQDNSITIQSIKAFSELSKTHKNGKKSFVIVSNNIDFNAVPKSLVIVPSLLEAYDIIEMEEIERDLGF